MNIPEKINFKTNGITLIALIITIVILIILATVTINAAFGEGGIIKKAQQAKELTEQAAKDEQEEMNSIMDKYSNIMAEGSEIQEPESPIEKIKGQIQDNTLKVEKVPLDSDEANPEETGIIYVPGGYGVAQDSPNYINDGIVMY